MFTRSKYIILEVGGFEQPVVFSELMIHFDTAVAIAPRSKVTGAGFCNIVDGQYQCYGESISLGVKSRGDVDSKILNKMLGAAK
jgi:hypothetical protein